ncbi:hypothetical protein GGR50DRAFT_350836 [Xylaria sp. CBS 124048]|nr:hypothetical protein GGR50DRAFT_350836 [Xylaria sp. CBS 124048]
MEREREVGDGLEIRMNYYPLSSLGCWLTWDDFPIGIILPFFFHSCFFFSLSKYIFFRPIPLYSLSSLPLFVVVFFRASQNYLFAVNIRLINAFIPRPPVFFRLRYGMLPKAEMKLLVVIGSINPIKFPTKKFLCVCLCVLSVCLDL